MATRKIGVIPNQVFVGLPWKDVRPGYEKCIDHLEKRYPIHFTIIGRRDAQQLIGKPLPAAPRALALLLRR